VREMIQSEDESKGSNSDLRWSQKWSGVAKPAVGVASGDGSPRRSSGTSGSAEAATDENGL
jgi:hypothetical protein